MRRLVAAAVCVAAASVASPGSATYSIIAVDSQAGAFGAAGASCVPYAVDCILGSVPGRGAFVAQASFDDLAFDAALASLADGASAPAVLALVSDARTFPQAPKMQYGVVDAAGGLVGWTGAEALPVAADVAGEHGSARFVALGNVLTSSAVLAQAGAGFRGDGCDLPARLMLAIEAAGADGEGDSRCTPEGRPANSAFLDVAGPRSTLVRISVPDVSPDDPIAELRSRFDAWRVDHPCPAPPAEGGAGGAGGAGEGEGGNDSAGDPEGAGGCRIHALDPRGSRAWVTIALAVAARSLRVACRLSCGPRPRPAQRRHRGGSRSGR